MSLEQPLRFAPIALEKVWGGERLAELYGARGARGPVGEVWQIVDRDEVSSVVSGGAYDGRSLRGLMLSEQGALLGSTRPSGSGHFPLLVKVIDAGANLSVQVHPDRRTAERLGHSAEGKTEAWYVLHAEPGSLLYLGLKRGIGARTFAAAAGSARIVDLLKTYAPRAGQFVLVPPGTVHAIGAGVTLLEVQENSDTTFRLFDWSRAGTDGTPRPLHVEEALHSIDYDLEVAGPMDPCYEGSESRRARLAACDPFDVELLELDAPLETATEGYAGALVVIEGEARLVLERTRADTGDPAEWTLRPREAWLVPAALSGFRLEPLRETTRILAVRVKG